MQRRSRIPRLAVSAIIVLAAVVPATYLIGPAVHRWYMLASLTSTDLDRRERALNYVIRNARSDPRVCDGAVARLDDAETANFIQIVNALDSAGQWSRDAAPLEAWLRWLTVLVVDGDARARVLAAPLLADLHEHADHPRVIELVDALAADDAAEVRYNALAAAAELAGAADDRDEWTAQIAAFRRDPEPAVARHAWLVLGLLDPVHGYEANWRDAPPDVAAAILWAVVRTNPSRPLPALEALSDLTAPKAVRAASVYALSESDAPEATAAIESAADDRDELVQQRAELAMHHGEIRPLLTDISADGLREAMLSGDPARRDVAVMLAARLLTAEDLEPLIEQLATDPRPGARMSAAMLYGMTGLGELPEPTDDESAWAVEQVNRLARWLRGEPDASLAESDRAADLLMRDDVPASTVLMCLLMLQDLRALDHLLNPRGEPDLGLLANLATAGWFVAATEYLPPGLPPLWADADPDLFLLQVDIARDWYLLHRHDDDLFAPR